MPMPWAISRAERTACAEQQLRSPSFSGSDHSSSVTATASAPASRTSNAATALSTPPLIATSSRFVASARAAWVRAAQPSALCSASAASSAACSLAALNPPSSAAICVAPIRAASSSFAPRTSSTVALPAAIAAPQPLASKPASRISPSGLAPSSSTETRIKSPQAAPPAAPVHARCGVWPRPNGRSMC